MMRPIPFFCLLCFVLNKALESDTIRRDINSKSATLTHTDQKILKSFSQILLLAYHWDLSHCYVMVMIWHDPFSFTKALASVVVWGFGGHSGSTNSSCARYMYFAFGIFFLHPWAQDKQHFPHWSTESCGGCVVVKRYSPCLSRLNTTFQRTMSRKKLWEIFQWVKN